MRYWVTRHLPPLDPALQTHEYRQDLVSETTTRDGRRSASKGTATIRMTSERPEVTEVVLEQAWRTEADPMLSRPEWLDALRLRRQLKHRIKQLQLDLALDARSE